MWCLSCNFSLQCQGEHWSISVPCSFSITSTISIRKCGEALPATSAGKKKIPTTHTSWNIIVEKKMCSKPPWGSGVNSSFSMRDTGAADFCIVSIAESPRFCSLVAWKPCDHRPVCTFLIVHYQVLITYLKTIKGKRKKEKEKKTGH